MPGLSFAQSEQTVPNDQPYRVAIIYIPPSNSTLRGPYDVLRDHRALEKIQEILSTFRWPEELTIKTAECGVVNSWYRREKLKPTITFCYEFLNHILKSLPNEVTPDGITRADAAVGQFLWVTLHEVGHTTFDMLDVPIFGSARGRRRQFCDIHYFAIRQKPSTSIDSWRRVGLGSLLGRLQKKSGCAGTTGGLCE